ncbi:histidine phosphatase family protein [Lysobacter sp. M15]|uniref:SixA phosphatase family protein n=1 Tax=Lysobacter sp. M15 TaxID=2916837 RepID=UPI001F574367|nr:histidine phosphatase family protein [Lysobacter sp. M15]
MRELILLRHAHADAVATGQIDADRPLSDEGRSEAQAAARWLKAQDLVPDRMLVSPTQRARETAEAVVAELGPVPTREEAAIYEASPGDLAGLADQNRDAIRLLMVGHNPGFEQLAALMHSGQSGDYRGMPPGGIAVLRLPVDAAIEPGIASLVAFWWP